MMQARSHSAAAGHPQSHMRDPDVTVRDVLKLLVGDRLAIQQRH